MAYRRLSRVVHPDKMRDDPQAESAFAAVNEAYRVRAPQSFGLSSPA